MRAASARLMAAITISIALLTSSASNAAHVGFEFEGYVGPGGLGDTYIIANTLRIETDESADLWTWSLECTTGCEIAGYSYNYGFGQTDLTPPGPGEIGSLMLWQAPSYAVISYPIPGYTRASDGSGAGPLGGATGNQGIPHPTAPNIVGNGLDVVVGWVTVHSVRAELTPDVETPWEYLAELKVVTHAGEGLSGENGPLATTFGTSYFDPSGYVIVPEPSTFVLVGLGLALLAGRRRPTR